MAETYSAIQAKITSLFANNTTGDISEADLREICNDILDFAEDIEVSGGSGYSTPAAVRDALATLTGTARLGTDSLKADTDRNFVDDDDLTALSKLLTSYTADRVLTTDGSGNLAVSSITTTILGYLSGLSANAQTQLDAKAPADEIDPAAVTIVSGSPNTITLDWAGNRELNRTLESTSATDATIAVSNATNARLVDITAKLTGTHNLILPTNSKVPDGSALPTTHTWSSATRTITIAAGTNEFYELSATLKTIDSTLYYLWRFSPKYQ
jgi:hypothetical protein